MKKTIASMGAAALLLYSHAAPASANSLARPSMMVEDEGFVQEVAHRHGFYVVRGIYYYNGHRGIIVARPGYRYYRGYWLSLIHI